jgi:hypothetical protein
VFVFVFVFCVCLLLIRNRLGRQVYSQPMSTCCYICHGHSGAADATDDDGSGEERRLLRLMPSPCGKCTAMVHRSCFDDLQVYEHGRCRCVVLRTGHSRSPPPPLQAGVDDDDERTDGVVVYTTCSMCHTRFEYASRALIHKIAAKMHRDAAAAGTDSATDTDHGDHGDGGGGASSEQRRAVAFMRWAHAVLYLLPADTRNHLLQSAQTCLQSVARLSVDEFARHLHQAAWCAKMAMYALSATAVLASITAARSAWQGLWW